MRRRQSHRKGVGTMIGGIIVLALILSALTAMIVLSQNSDAYQTIANRMSGFDVERFSEHIQIVYPGIDFPGKPVSCAGAPSCNQFTMRINNLANIGIQVARIYINSTGAGCNVLCMLDPAPTAKEKSFRSSDRFITPREQSHSLTFWLPSTALFTDEAVNMVSIVTTRGRVFSFQFPIPAVGGSVTPSGALALGCLIFFVNPNLITYTSPVRTIPPKPISGAWKFPHNTYLIMYLRVSNICTSPVKLLDRSAITAMRYTGAGAGRLIGLYLASPMSTDYCQYFPGSHCIPTTSGNRFPSGQGAIQAYNASHTNYSGDSCPATDPCYILPAAPFHGQAGRSVYLLLSAADYCSAAQQSCPTNAGKANQLSPNNPNLYVAFLAMYWQCTEDTDPTCAKNYQFGITLPFITLLTFAGP